MGIDSGFNSNNTESFIRIDTNEAANPNPAARPEGTRILLDGSDGSGWFLGDVEADDFISTRSTGNGAKGVTLYVNSVTGSDVFRNGVFIHDLASEDTTDVTPQLATYNPATGALTLTFVWGGAALTTADLITFKEGALTFSCNSGQGVGNLSSPEITDSNFGSAFQIQNVVAGGGSVVVSLNVGKVKTADANVAHTFVSALAGGTVVIRKTAGDVLTTNQMLTAGYSELKPFATIARAALEAGRITMGVAGFSSEFYDRIVIKVAPGDQITNNNVSTGGEITTAVSPSGATYDAATGALSVTFPDPGTPVQTKDLITFDAGALTFSCQSGNLGPGNLASPLVTDDNFGQRFPILTVVSAGGNTTITCNVGSAKTASNAVHTFVSAVAGGTDIIYTPTIDAWADGYVPSSGDLQELNDSRGGVILPRGVSVIGEDLRKTIVRPTFVPNKAGDITTNRSAIFRVTGGSFFFNFTFKDRLNYEESHHLLDCFAFTNTAELNNFYNRVAQIAGIVGPYSIANPGETVITAVQPPDPTTVVDGVTGSSPYIFNCSVRSLYGLCGIFADGDEDASGFKSMVVAQFTGVSLQKDTAMWQTWNAGTWSNFTGTYDQLIAADPNETRMNPARMSAHVRAINDAVIQEVSVFAIGQGVHHWAQSGGELTVTNSNSNFGGCAAIAEGFKDRASNNDTDWTVNRIRNAVDLPGKFSIRLYSLGTASASGNTSVTLNANLTPGSYDANTPKVLEDEGYTLRDDSYIWIRNPLGNDYRARLAANAFVAGTPNQINVDAGGFETEDGDAPGSGANFPAVNGLEVYVRRMRDGRNQDERRYSIIAGNATGSRNPIRDYVIQTDLDSPVVDSLIPSGSLSTISKSLAITGGAGNALVELRANDADTSWAAGNYYRVGDTVRRSGKHFTCTVTNSDATDPAASDKWAESYVHMPEAFDQEAYFANAQPILIFDDDTVGTMASAESATQPLGWILNDMWTSAGAKYVRIQNQLRTATDYKGLFQFLNALGGANWTQANVNTLLTPQAEANRERDPSGGLDGLNAPNGAVNAWANWAIEWRRPSNIRLFGHAYEWTGYLNYSKALPKYQQELGPLNRFTYYFTNVDGGRCYVSGFNEEGFIVFPNGIRDLTTNEDILIGDIGIEQPADDIQLPTVNFENVVISGDLVVQGDTILGQACGDQVIVNGSMLVGCTVLPSAADVDLGSEEAPFRNMYTGDLHLNNERGSWTMIEEDTYLSLRNNKTGVTYKLLMEEV